MRYVGRFAPSPTGALHDGSVVAALGSWLDARAAGGRWLVRIEDVDRPRCRPEAALTILGQLDALSLRPDEPVVWQSSQSAHYDAALTRLRHQHDAYDCGCSRRDIDDALSRQGRRRQRHREAVYPGTCRGGLGERAARSVRFAIPSGAAGFVRWQDRRLGDQCQDVAQTVGDFVLRRADRLWAYQLAVVVDDAAQGITDVVRGEDLADNTARQILLQRALGLPTPRYLHLPLVRAANGEKLSKQTGAQAADIASPLRTLQRAAATLGLREAAHSVSTAPVRVDDWLHKAVAEWRARVSGSLGAPPIRLA